MDERDPFASATTLEQEQRHLRPCAHPDCAEAGLYRARLSPRNGRQFVWLCLEHVREHNAAWDYFADMDEEQIEASRRADSTWERPTWRMGSLGGWQATAQFEFDEAFGRFSTGADRAQARRDGATGKPLDKAQRRALSVLGLEQDATKQEIKARYKSLAKKLHPDANGSDPKAEERLKRINQAYATLKSLA